MAEQTQSLTQGEFIRQMSLEIRNRVLYPMADLHAVENDLKTQCSKFSVNYAQLKKAVKASLEDKVDQETKKATDLLSFLENAL